MITLALTTTLLAAALAYSVLVIVAARRYLAVRVPESTAAAAEPVSILKPLAGLDADLESNLRTFFEQDYGEFEILFAVRHDDDPALEVVERLRAEYARIATRVIITGEPPYANAKVYSLELMLREAAHDLVVMSDSDIRVQPDLLRVASAEFQDSRIGVATCPYRAISGRSLWSRLEATGMNADFLAGILVARMLEGMQFAVGPTIVARRWALESIGGFQRMKDYLAEDFVLGKFAAQAGHGVILSSYVVEHHIGTSDFRKNAAHRLRWARSTRRSRPLGYLGQALTMPLAWAVAVCAVAPAWWPAWGIVLPLTLAVRGASAYMVSTRVLHARTNWLLMPLEDLAACAFWIAGFFGSTIEWRGRRYRLHSDGRFELMIEG